MLRFRENSEIEVETVPFCVYNNVVVNIVFRRFLHKEIIWRQKEARSRDYALLFLWMTSLYTPCLWTVWRIVYTQPRWQISSPTRIRTCCLQMTSPSWYEWAIGAGVYNKVFIDKMFKDFQQTCEDDEIQVDNDLFCVSLCSVHARTKNKVEQGFLLCVTIYFID